VILFLLPQFSGGGAERVILNILRGLHNCSHSVGIIVFNTNGPLLSMLPDGVQVYNLGTLTLKSSIFPLIRKLQQLKPEVLFSTFGYINVALLAVHWLLPRETKIWIREANLPSISLPNNSYAKLMTILYKLLYRRADKLICTSKRMKNEFIVDFSIPECIIEILPNLVDVDVIRSSSIMVKRFDKGGVCYIAAGRLTFQKGFDRLLRWFSELENVNSTLVILGNGDLKGELIRDSKSLEIHNRVKFVEFCDNPWQWYAGADVFLLSSRWEGMSNSVLESLTCGTPVIATEESGGIKEIIEEDKSDSIIIATGEQQFINAMNKAMIKDKSSEFISLLPNRYRKTNVLSIVEGWFV
jgi:glycosyltransferase involved in cell wall biosynthesis